MKNWVFILLLLTFGIAKFAPAAVTNAPQLTVSSSGTNLLLSWPASAWNYAPQFRPNLHQPPNWTNVNGSSTVSNGMRQMLVAPPAAAGYFRLALLSGPFTNSIGMAMTP